MTNEGNIMNNMKKIILISMMLLIIVPVFAVTTPPIPTQNFTISFSVDIANGTYTKGLFGNMILTGNLSVWDLISGAYAPYGDALVGATGQQDSYFFLFMIVWALYLMFIWISTSSTILPAMIGIGSASFVAILIPAWSFPIFTILFIIGLITILYKIFID